MPHDKYLTDFAACVPCQAAAGAPLRGLLKEITQRVSLILTNQPIYKLIETKTQIPWWFIGILHHMESDSNMTKHLHNGDSLLKRTVNVPAGRPTSGNPPFKWEDSAIDALNLKGMCINKVKTLPDGTPDWTLGMVLWRFENWNGWGYYNHGLRSPYLWAGCNLEQSGKYVYDGYFDPNKWSTQIGAAVLLKHMMNLDMIRLFENTSNQVGV